MTVCKAVAAMKSVLVLLSMLGVAWITPAWADATIAERIAALSKRIEQQPQDPALRLHRALLYLDDNQREPALADVVAAESLGDPLAAAPTHGLLLYRLGDFAAARPYFDRYLQANPQDWSVRKYRAQLLRDMGENELALADYEVLLRMTDELDPGYYVVTARLMASVPQRGVVQALALLDERIAQRGNLAILQRAAIDLEVQRGNFPAAIARMSQLDERLRATPQWQVEIAELLLRAGRAEEARPYLDVAQEQLQSGRMTGIRRQLVERARQLRAQVDATLRQQAGDAEAAQT